MQRNCCHISFAFILKFLNFLQAFIGVSIIIYSIWMLDQWNHHVPISPPSSSPPPAPSPASLYLFLNSRTAQPTWVSDHPLNFLVSATDDGLGFDLTSVKLPAPWFIYSFMGVGILLCCITLIGCIAAEAISGCCLCFYTLIKTVFILLEAALAAFIAIDRHWEKDLPYDPTGELDNLRSFIENNVDICKWAGITVIIIQALSLLLAIVLRAMASTRRTDLGDEDDYEIARGRREPLLNSQSNQTSGSTHSDIWSSRIREKAPFDEPYYPFTIGRSRGRKRNKDLLFEVDFPVHRPMTRSLTWSRNNLVLEPNTMGGSSKSDEMKAILREIQATNEARVAEVESRMSAQMHQLTLQLDEVLARLNRNQGGESQVGTSSSNAYGKPPYKVENWTNQPPGSAVVPRYTKLE